MTEGATKLRADTLGVHDEDGEVLRLALMSDQLVDRKCPGCAGRFVFGFVVDDAGELVAKHEGGLPFLLHTAPPCEPFTRLAFRDVFSYLRTGEATESKPIMPSEAKPDKPRKVHHR